MILVLLLLIEYIQWMTSLFMKKLNRTVPVILSLLDTQKLKSVELLLQCWKNVKVASSNPFLFGLH